MTVCDGCGKPLSERMPKEAALLCLECYGDYKSQSLAIENLKKELCGRSFRPKKEVSLDGRL